MALNLKAILQKHKSKLIIVAVGLFIAFVMNPEFFSQKNTAISSSPPKEPKLTQNQVKKGPLVRTIGNVKTVKTYERDRLYYTQGLAFKDSQNLIESTGLYGDSFIQYLDAKTMKVIHSQPLDAKYFGEGCEIVTKHGEQEIVQLTWKERDTLVWDAKDLTLKRKIPLPQQIKEGWGLTKRFEKDENGKEVLNFYVTDGTDFVYVVDAETWEIRRKIQVKTIEGQVIRWINELEFVRGKLWANVYYADSIVIIDTETGLVDTRIDLSQFKRLAQAKMKELNKIFKQDYVLNGIAYDQTNDRLIVTGKNWPLIWEIKVEGV